MYQNRLQYLPTEVIYSVFDYLPAHDILLAFSSINTFFDAALLTYPSYRLNFKSILKPHFDFVCSRIAPRQVISLTLSDLEDTPGQTELFFSRFPITAFSHLRLLELINIEHTSWEYIYPYLNHLDHHHRLAIVSADGNRLPYPQFLGHASQLQISSASYLKAQVFPSLRCLTLSQSSITELRNICSSAIQLKSLRVNQMIFEAGDDLILSAQYLKRLALYFVDVPVSMAQMSHLLSNLSRLRHLELRVKGSLDLANGKEWETLGEQLITFHFDFDIRIDQVKLILDRFRTPFWIQEKQWFVAYASEHPFSVPYLWDRSGSNSTQLPFHTTLLDETLLFDHINHFVVDNSLYRCRPLYFRHVKTLELQVSNRLDLLLGLIDLNEVENLILSCAIQRSDFSFLLALTPRVQQLSINTPLQNFLEQVQNMPLEHIRSLRITGPLINGDFYSLELLGRLFPKVEILHVNSTQWKTAIARLIDRFPNLSNVSFRLQSNRPSETNSSMKKSMISETRRLTDEMFTCRRRVNRTAAQSQAASFDLWIGKQDLELSYKRRCLPQRGYKFHRLNHFFSQNILFRLLGLTLFFSTTEFAVLYALLISTGRWYTVVVLILFSIGNLIYSNYLRDTLSGRLSILFGIGMYGALNYRVSGTWNSLFFYDIFAFMCNPLGFSFGPDSTYLLINFYLLFSLWLCNCVCECRPNTLVFRSFQYLTNLIAICYVLVNVYLSLTYIIPLIASFLVSISHLWVYFPMMLCGFIIARLIRSR